MNDQALTKLATQLRIDVIEMLSRAGSGHAAGSLSAADLFAFMYFFQLRHRSGEPNWLERDYFLVSNGHISSLWYATLARAGYFPIKELVTYRQFGSRLQGHPWNIKMPGIFNASGMLGHGPGQAIGLALGLKLDKKSNHVYCFMSDGEQQEGAVWEAAMSAVKFGLDNLTFILDKNDIQIDGTTSQIMPLQIATNQEETSLVAKYRSFGWHVTQIDGHDFTAMHSSFPHPPAVSLSASPPTHLSVASPVSPSPIALLPLTSPTEASQQVTISSKIDLLQQAQNMLPKHASLQSTLPRPHLIIAQTTSGKGVSFMENNYHYHDWRNDPQESARALQELKQLMENL